jgi:cellulose synthase/poly-beta-1,6-N-acetylglucosamine synthase-like glycosyltransferase
MLLYDCVLEGLAALRRSPCYGTNFVMRRKAIREAGGWDERNKITQTEDLATSYTIHSQGWQSLYFRHAYAVGLSPPSLHSYLRQQLRWAIGNTALWFSILRQIISPKSLSPSWKIAVTYLWSSGFYVNTLAITSLAVFPTIVLIYEVLLRNHTQPQVIQAVVSGASAFEWAYLSLYPLYIVVMFFPYLNMRLRGYPLRNMMLVQALMAVSAPVYLRGIRQAVFSKKPITFITTRKAHQSELKNRLHLIIAPQTISFAVFFLTGTLVMQRCLEGPVSPIAWIIVFWTFIHTVSLGHYFLFSSGKAWETHAPEIRHARY